MKHSELAREAIREFINNGKIMECPANLSQEFKHKKGVFVSLKKEGQLRGCIGTVTAFHTLSEEIVQNAIAAATRDPRFPSVSADEIDQLTISVDVLEPEEAIRSKNELDPKKYGVIVEQGYKRGLLLPDLEGVDTVDEQLEIAKQKAGISGEGYTIKKFKVTRYD